MGYLFHVYRNTKDFLKFIFYHIILLNSLFSSSSLLVDLLWGSLFISASRDSFTLFSLTWMLFIIYCLIALVKSSTMMLNSSEWNRALKTSQQRNIQDHMTSLVNYQIRPDQSLSPVQLFATPWITVHQASLSINQLPEFTQIHVHRVNDAIQPSHPLSSPSPPAPNPSQHQSFFQWVSSSHEVAKVLEFQP